MASACVSMAGSPKPRTPILPSPTRQTLYRVVLIHVSVTLVDRAVPLVQHPGHLRTILRPRLQQVIKRAHRRRRFAHDALPVRAVAAHCGDAAVAINRWGHVDIRDE